MFRPQKALLGLIALSTGAWVVAHARQTNTERPRVVLTDREAFLLADAEMIAGSEVTGLAPSPEGRYVLAVRTRRELPALLSAPGQEPPGGDVSLVLWNSRTRSAVPLWRRPLGTGSIQAIAWLSGSDLALITARVSQTLPGGGKATQRVLMLADSSRAAVRAIANLSESESLDISPTQPLAVLRDVQFGETGGQPALRIVRSNGSVRTVPGLPKNSGWNITEVHWSTDGSSLYFVAHERPAPTPPGEATTAPRRRAVPKWHALDLRTATVRPLSRKPASLAEPRAVFSEKQPALPVRIKQGMATAKEENTTQTLRPLWLESAAESEEPRALLAPDSRMGLLLPDGTAAIYLSGGALYAVPILRVDKNAFLEARRNAQKVATMSNAKQLGTALMMYAQDYDENFPLAGDTKGQLLPYVKNEAIFNNPATGSYGFAFTYSGSGGLAGILSPAETIIGYVSGPGGRAIIYADGHVKWKDD